MSNNFYSRSSPGRDFELIQDAFDKLPTLTGNGSLFVRVKSDASGLEAISNADFIASLQTAGAFIVGEIRAFAFETAPSRWLECDGSAISRTTYSDLFSAIGDTFGIGDGSTTFNVPDLRGEFIRGWAHGSTNDPDKATRTDSGDGTTGDKVGTKQDDAFKAHTHATDFPALQPWRGNVGTNIFGGTAAETETSGSTGGNETRPRNVYMMYCIYAGV